MNNRPHSFLSTWSIAIICLSAIILSPIVIGAARSLKVHANDVKQWLPRDFQAAKDYEWFIERFGVDEMVVISWPGCTLDNPQVEMFSAALREHEVDGEKVFERTITARSMIDRITAAGVSEEVAKRRIKGLLLGPDERQTCVVAFPSSTLNNRRAEIVGRITRIAQEQFGLDAETLKMGGPTVDGAAIDIESRRALDQFMWVTVVIVFLIAWLRLRDLLLAICVMGFSVGCAFLSLSILHWTGGSMNLTMMMLPTLTFILGVSACIHMANYYRKAVAEGYGWLAADQALKVAAVPVTMSSVTTAIGLASLAISKVMPIRQFGIYSAIGILCSLPIILLLMPSVLFWFRGRIGARAQILHKSRRQQTTGVSRTISWLVHKVCRHHMMVAVPSLLILVVLSVGITWLQGSVDLKNRFSQRTKIIQDYHWLETHLGPLVPMEVVVRFGPENDLNLWQQMLIVEQLQRDLKRNPLISATFSAATFKPLFPRGNSLRTRMVRRLAIEKWQRDAPSLRDARLIATEGDATLWRISLRVTALQKIDYGDFLDSVQSRVNQQLAEMNPKNVSTVFTGGIPLFYHAQHQILADLENSFITAFIFISLVLILVLRSIPAGLVAMIPNVFPPLVVFGAMGWMGLPIEIGSVMTASVALGIAVDDTLHFLTWYRRAIDQNRSRLAAIRHAFEHCAKPMIDSSLICGFGVAAFMFADFMPTVRFSRLLFILLMAALVGDLFLLPALLAGPFGSWFYRRRRKTAVGPPVPPPKMAKKPKSKRRISA